MPVVFSYGSLQETAVQFSVFGRLLEGRGDELIGFEPSLVEVTELNSEVGAITRYANVIFNGRKDSHVVGTAFEVTDAELAKTDIYEKDAGYHRISTTLGSGSEAWVYLHDDPVDQERSVVS